MKMSEEDHLAHYGMPRRSGRYPWGSGENPYQRNKGFLGMVHELRKEGVSDADIARGFGMTSTQLRAKMSIARNENRQADISMAQRLRDRGWSYVAIGERMGMNESSVRSLLAPGQKDKVDVLESTANMLKRQVEEKGYIDVGTGVERDLPGAPDTDQRIGISKEKLNTAIARLQEEGYKIHHVNVEQLGTGKFTKHKVLGGPDSEWKEVVNDPGLIKLINEHSDDGGRTYLGIKDPVSIDSKRVHVRYAEDGGTEADGVIYVRPGVDDITLGGSNYAQVRIAVDGTHYLKGMAMYNPNMPDGVDLVFNTNKSKKDVKTKLEAMKPLTGDPDNPFGATIKPGGQHGVMNILSEEGDWSEWSRTLSSQILSKQSPKLAKTQLDMASERMRSDLKEITELTNPAVRRKLLNSFADGADAAAVHLKAAALPRQASHVILPVKSMKPTEIYAPNYRDGERVVLIRHPHGGIFEIPELTVNNRQREAKSLLGNARDAVGINSAVAERLSGADFDGDTVLVIPNNDGKVKTAPAIESLRTFDPRRSYPAYDGMPRLKTQTKNQLMGDVSNLITDMTIQGAPVNEIARAVRHSMVVIDAENHHLNYKQSALDNGIPQLKTKYQGGPRAGASTLISRASGEIRISNRVPRPASQGGPIDKATGKKVFVETGESWVDSRGKVHVKKFQTERLAVTDDAHTLSSGTPIEKVYADHSNRLKSMANEARREMVNTRSTPYSPSAKAAYSNEVVSLNSKLNIALLNAPRERQAQVIANTVVAKKKQANPDMEPERMKKLKAQALAEARTRTGAHKDRIEITPSEWEAIQSGAISNHKLTQILNNADLDQIKKLATPTTAPAMTSAKISRAKAMAASGYTQAEIADALGVSVSTISNAIS